MRLCSVENCNSKHFANGYCQKHHDQIRHHGKIRKRSMQDPNEIIVEGQICRMKIYNMDCEEIAETIFDLKYKEDIEKFKWHLCYDYVESVWYENGVSRTMMLHQAIFHLSGQNLEIYEEIDHKDRNKLNNLETNLRRATRTQNCQNKQITNTNTSGYKGVHYDKQNKKWRAQIYHNGQYIYLGYFNIKEDAARAYNIAAAKYHGEFAVINKILETNE